MHQRATEDVAMLVSEVLAALRTLQLGNLTDLVCVAIEGNPDWLARYEEAIRNHSEDDKDGKLTVNSSIGWYTKIMSELENTGSRHLARSRLIHTYSQLGPEAQIKRSWPRSKSMPVDDTHVIQLALLARVAATAERVENIADEAA